MDVDISLCRVLRSSAEIIKFLRQLHDSYYILMSFSEFLRSGLEKISKLEEIGTKRFFKNFFEVEYENFFKVKSIRMYKKSGGRYSQMCVCQVSWLRWRVKDFIITRDGVLYCDSFKTAKEFISFGCSFQYKLNTQDVDCFAIKLRSNHRILSIRAQSLKSYFIFLFYLDKALQSVSHIKRFDSFAPIRIKNEVKFLVDGAHYFYSLAKVLEKAKEEVFIAGWWVSPEVNLIRSSEGVQPKYRLDNMISHLAKKGVKIYIIVYWETSFLPN